MTKRIFISHAATDAPLAALFQRLLLVSGVPRGQIFYSSDRSTGVPAGRGSREVLRETLRGNPFVIELITPMFMTRPMCLMELGAAWVQELDTFPVVVPPLTREQVILQIGDAHLPLLGDPGELHKLFDELQDRVGDYLETTLSASLWNPAVRELTENLPAVLVKAFAATESLASELTEPSPDTQRLDSRLVATKIKKLDKSTSIEIVGDVINESSSAITMLILSATLFDDTGEILGTAQGSVSQLSGGVAKTFRLLSSRRVEGVAGIRLQIDGEL